MNISPELAPEVRDLERRRGPRLEQDRDDGSALLRRVAIVSALCGAFLGACVAYGILAVRWGM